MPLSCCSAAGSGGAGVASGKIAGALANGDPNLLMSLVQRSATTGLSLNNLGTTIARCASFRLSSNLIVNKIRYYGNGTTTNDARVAIYRYSDLARMMPETAFSTAANTWGAAGSALNVSLAADVLYFIAIAAATGAAVNALTTWGVSNGTGTGRIITAPGALPGNLDLDAGFFSGYLFEFATVGGALPDPAPALAAASAWTGGFPAFWLDNSNA